MDDNIKRPDISNSRTFGKKIIDNPSTPATTPNNTKFNINILIFLLILPIIGTLSIFIVDGLNYPYFNTFFL